MTRLCYDVMKVRTEKYNISLLGILFGIREDDRVDQLSRFFFRPTDIDFRIRKDFFFGNVPDRSFNKRSIDILFLRRMKRIIPQSFPERIQGNLEVFSSDRNVPPHEFFVINSSIISGIIEELFIRTPRELFRGRPDLKNIWEKLAFVVHSTLIKG